MHLLSLPYDILLKCFRLLPAPDLLLLRRTCKFLYDLTFDEHVWRAVLRIQCLQNDVPLISYNFANMDANELEEAASKPYRFQQILEQVDPRHKRSRTFRLSVAGDIPEDTQVTDAITTMEMIPGGRYLVTTSESGWLRCWDLMARVPPYDPSSTYDQLTPEASYNAGAPIHGAWLQRSVQSSSNIVTAINVEQWAPDDGDGLWWRSKLNLFTLRLSPIKYGSSFALEAILDLPDFYLWLLEGDFIVFVDEFLDIRVWNWKLGLWGYIKDESNMAIDSFRGGLSNVMMSGTHIVLFNAIAAGMTYRLYALPKLYASRCEAEASGGESTLLQAVLFAPDGLDVDFPLTWRPTTMYNPADDTYVAISNIPFIVVTYDCSTQLFVLPGFVPTTKYERTDDEEDENGMLLPLLRNDLFLEPAIDLPYMHKQNYADHVRITSGFDAAFMVWLNHDEEWTVMSTRYDEHYPTAAARSAPYCCDPTLSSTVGRSDHDRRRWNTGPRNLGSAVLSHPRLCLSPMSGTAFHTTHVDRRVGAVHMWEWMVPEPEIPDIDWNKRVMEAFGFEIHYFGVPPTS